MRRNNTKTQQVGYLIKYVRTQEVGFKFRRFSNKTNIKIIGSKQTKLGVIFIILCLFMCIVLT